MNIEVYSKPGCGKCAAAKSKLKMMGLLFTEHNIQHYTTLHDGWRDDGSADVLAVYTMMDTLPIFRIDNEFCDYPHAMKMLKSMAAPAPAAAAPVQA